MATKKFEGYAGQLKKSVSRDLNKIPLKGPKNTKVANTGKYGLYYDSLGNLTGGIGHLITSQNDASRFINISENVANQIFEIDREAHAEGARKAVEKNDIAWNSLPAEVQTILEDMAFNLGATKLATWKNTFKTLKKDAETGDFNNFANKLEKTLWYKQVGDRAKTHVATLKGLKMENKNSLTEDTDIPSEAAKEDIPTWEETAPVDAAPTWEDTEEPTQSPRWDDSSPNQETGNRMVPRPGATIGSVNVPDPNTAESFVTGFMNELPGVKQISAGAKALADRDSNLSFSKRYRAYLGENKLTGEVARREHPYAHGAGEISSLVVGGAGLAKGLTKLPKVGLLFTPKKGVTFGEKAVGYSQVLGRNVVADSALVGTKQILDEEAFNLKDAGEIAGNVVVNELANNLVGGALGLTANSLATPLSYGSQRLLNSETAKLLKNYVKGKTATSVKKLNALYNDVGSDFVEKTLKNAGIDAKDFTVETFKDSISKRRGVIGESLSSAYDEMDAALGGRKIPISDLYENISLQVRQYYSRGGTKVEAAASEKLLNRLRKEFFTKDSLSAAVVESKGNALPQELVPIEKSVSQLWGFRKVFNEPTLANKMLGQKVPRELQDMIGGEFTKFLKRAPHALGDVALDAGEEIASKAPRSTRLIQEKIDGLNKEYRTLLRFSDDVVNGLQLPDDATLASTFGRKLFDSVSLTGVGVSAAIGLSSGSVSQLGVGATATGLAAAIRTVKDRSDLVIKELGSGPNSVLGRLSRLSDQMYKNYNDPYVSQLIPSLVRAAQSEALSDEEFEDLVYDYDSRLNLYSNPISRNDESVKERLGDILNVAGRVAPELAEAIVKRRESGEDTGDIFDQLSKTPEMSRFFEPGTGWNGRLYSEEDKAAAIDRVNKLYLQGNLPAVKKREMEQMIQTQGIVPSEVEAQ